MQSSDLFDSADENKVSSSKILNNVNTAHNEAYFTNEKYVPAGGGAGGDVMQKSKAVAATALLNYTDSMQTARSPQSTNKWRMELQDETETMPGGSGVIRHSQNLNTCSNQVIPFPQQQ